MKEPTATLYDILRGSTAEGPDWPALISNERSLSRGQFLEQVDQLAHGMAGAGVSSGDRVAILSLNSIEYLTVFGACARIGAIACPVSWRLSPEEIGGVLALCAPRMLAVGPAHIPMLETPAAQAIPLRVTLAEEAPPGTIPVRELRKAKAIRLDPPAPSDPLAILPTAAMAGLPRGAIVTHANLVAASDRLIDALRLTRDDRHLAALPLFHITGLGLSLALLQAGGSNILLEIFDPVQASNAIDNHRITIMADFPPVLQMMLDARAASEGSWASLRCVVGLDAPDTIARLHQETGARFWTGFGQAETTGVVTLGAVDERPGSAGRTLPGLEVRCVDDADRDVPVGQPGEIVVQGPVVFAGYWGDPDASDYVARGGWHHTGDLGRFDADGFLFYAGRKPEKELIKTGGENVYPEEVERVIRELPGVAAVCVIGVPDPTYGETVKAVVELTPGRELGVEEIQDAVAARIASFKKPRIVAFVSSLPRDGEGRVDREAVKASHG